MMDAPEIKKIKALENITFAEFVREAVREHLRKYPNNAKETPREPIGTYIFSLKHNIYLSINDYLEIFMYLDINYHLDFKYIIKKNEQDLMAFVVFKLLMLEFNGGDISDQAATYFMSLISPLKNHQDDIDKIKNFNFSEYFNYLYNKDAYINTSGLIKSTVIFIKDYLSLENTTTAINLLASINLTLLKLLKTIFNEQNLRENEGSKINEQIVDIYENIKPFNYENDNFWVQINISESKWDDGSNVYITLKIKKSDNVLYMGMQNWIKFIDIIKNKNTGFYLECENNLGLIKSTPISMNIEINHDFLRQFIIELEEKVGYQDFYDLSYRI